jgi:hypothetical protein
MNARVERLAHRPVRIHVLGGVLTLITLAALTGGVFLLADPSGAALGMSVTDMGTAPFPDYTVPATVLLVLFGLLPIPILIGLWREKRWARELAGMIGAALVVWITAQVIWFGLVSPVQPVVWFAGLALLSFGGAPVWKRSME